MIAYELENIGILNIKVVNYRCVLWSITRNDAINRLNNLSIALMSLIFLKIIQHF